MDERAAWLRLSLVPGLGPRGTQALLSVIDSPAAVLRSSHARLAEILGHRLAVSVLTHDSSSAISDIFRWLDQKNRYLLTLHDPAYPEPLKDIADPPPVLFAEGRLELLANPALAIVGSRHPTPQGEANAEAFAHHLASQGLTIVSGLAWGIDAAAHRGALGGAGSTIAVMATGPDRVYPRQHAPLARRIRHEGLILAESPPGSGANPGLFVRRNRLVSGLSKGVLVVEAALSSGSLITARQGADQGREVFAIPGSIHSPLSKGCHALIREGAKLVDEARHILEELRLSEPVASTQANGTREAPKPQAKPSPALPEAARRLLQALGFEAMTPDQLCFRCGLTPDVVSAMLTVLELHGLIGAMPGNAFQRIVREPGAAKP